MLTIGAFGGRPADLGGYRTHNPFRLFARERFRAFLRARVGDAGLADLTLLIAADLGPGQWFAEVAREEGVPFRLVAKPAREGRWNAYQRAGMAELAEAAADVVESEEPEAFICGGLLSRAAAAGVRLAFAAAERGKQAGAVAGALRRLREGGVTVVDVDPADLPPAYLAMAAVEDAREAVPDNLVERLAEGRRRLDDLVASGKLSPATMERARRRRQQLSDLEAGLRALLDRGDGA